MISRIAHRSVVLGSKRPTILSRAAFSSLNQFPKKIESNPPRNAEFSTAAELATADDVAPIGKRFKLTYEVILSKVFWAGFGWQGSCVIADTKLGYSADSMAFALTTGAGEGLAVFTGHSLFYSLIMGGKPSQELSTGLWLGTGTFFSGTAWQPIVNALVTLSDNSFPHVAAGTWVVCGSMFYVGLRVGRAMWGEMLGAEVAARDYENLCSDAGLSLAIGGATAMFVACDPSMAMNWFAPAFGVLDTDTTLMSMCRAGAATATGYGLAQCWLNFLPKGRNWMDMYF